MEKKLKKNIFQKFKNQKRKIKSKKKIRKN